MNCSVIYYSARKTSFCEKALKKSFPELGLNFKSAVFAVKKEALGGALMKLNKVEAGLPAVIEAIKAERETVRDSIEVAQ